MEIQKNGNSQWEKYTKLIKNNKCYMKKSGKEERKKLMINSFCVVREREIFSYF